MKKFWMIFQVVGTGVHYIWNGKFPIILRVGTEDGSLPDWYWDGLTPSDVTPIQKTMFDEMAKSRKPLTKPVYFTVDGRLAGDGKTPVKYRVIARGEYKEA